MVLIPNPTPADNQFTSRGIGTNNLGNFLANTYVDLTPTKNAVTNLLNRIGLVNIIRAPRVANPFARFMGTEMPYGWYIQNLAMGDTKPELFDPKSCARGFVGTDITAWYAEMNDQVIYKKSVSDTEIAPGVHDSVGLFNVADGILDSLMAWVQNDIVTKFEKQFARVSIDGADVSGYTGGYQTIPIQTGEGVDVQPRPDEEIALDVGNAVIYLINEFKGMRTTYNKLGAPMTCARPIVLMPRHVYIAMRKALAQTYHLEPYDIDADIILVDSFATPPGDRGQIGALIIDPRSVLYHQQIFNTEAERCSTGRSTLYSTVMRGAFNFMWGLNAVAILLGTDKVDYTPTPVTMPAV